MDQIPRLPDRPRPRGTAGAKQTRPVAIEVLLNPRPARSAPTFDPSIGPFDAPCRSRLNGRTVWSRFRSEVSSPSSHLVVVSR